MSAPPPRLVVTRDAFARDAVARAIVAGGAIVLIVGLCGTLWLDGYALSTRAVPDEMTALHAPLLWVLRSAFLFMAVGAAVGARLHMPAPWRWAFVGACVVLTASALGDVVSMLVQTGVLADPTTALGPLDSVQRRLFRLGAMASRAVPLVALLALWEHTRRRDTPAPPNPSRLATLLLRYEHVLFAVGASTLALILMAAAFIHKELTWLLPVGADTTLAGCAAAAIRARRRSDPLAFAGWLVVSVSMGAGLLMGTYSFGGPLPTPAVVGPYDALTRMLLRDTHVIAIVGGIAAIGLASVRGRAGDRTAS